MDFFCKLSLGVAMPLTLRPMSNQPLPDLMAGGELAAHRTNLVFQLLENPIDPGVV
jgi:hypothetical protein